MDILVPSWTRCPLRLLFHLSANNELLIFVGWDDFTRYSTSNWRGGSAHWLKKVWNWWNWFDKILLWGTWQIESKSKSLSNRGWEAKRTILVLCWRWTRLWEAPRNMLQRATHFAWWTSLSLVFSYFLCHGVFVLSILLESSSAPSKNCFLSGYYNWKRKICCGWGFISTVYFGFRGTWNCGATCS